MFGNIFKFKMKVLSKKYFYALNVKYRLIARIIKMIRNLDSLLKQWKGILEIKVFSKIILARTFSLYI